jgi:hypothetical protein
VSFVINFQGTAVVEATMTAAATVEVAAAMIDTEYSFACFPCFFTQLKLKLDFNAKLWWMLLAILLSLSRLVLHSLFVLFTIHVSFTVDATNVL